MSLPGGPWPRYFFFPVEGSGSWQHAIDAGAKPREVPFVCQEVQREMQLDVLVNTCSLTYLFVSYL